MITLMILLGLGFGAWWVSNNYTRLKSQGRPFWSKFGRQAGGVLAIATAVILGARGRLDMALLVGSGGAWLLGWDALWGFLRGGQALPGASGAVSAGARIVEAAIDRRTGQLGAVVRSGAFAGRPLDALSAGELLTLRRACLLGDPEGVRLVEAYLDGRSPAWREDAELDGDPRGRADPQNAAMTQEEAYQVLGLQAGASAEEIRRAHRALVVKLHPDGGGSTYLASRVNQAKDTLLNRQR